MPVPLRAAKFQVERPVIEHTAPDKNLYVNTNNNNTTTILNKQYKKYF